MARAALSGDDAGERMSLWWIKIVNMFQWLSVEAPKLELPAV